MHKDEWGMVVNAPSAPNRTIDPLVATQFWPSALLPGEQVLWRGAPRPGAGWRCLLQESDVVGMVFLWVGLGAPVFVGFFLNGLDGSSILPAVAGVIVLGLVVASALLAIRGGQLRRMHYVVTDRRAFAIGGLTNPGRIVSVVHAAAKPSRCETRCGTTIVVGSGVVGNKAAARWDKATGMARFAFASSDDAPQVIFRALDPEQAPYQLLCSLAGFKPARSAQMGSTPAHPVNRQ